jgi:hypothetical protein
MLEDPRKLADTPAQREAREKATRLTQRAINREETKRQRAAGAIPAAEDRRARRNAKRAAYAQSNYPL